MKIHRDLTLVLPYYMNPSMLQEHQAIWASYPDQVRAHLHVIIVDDGSPTDPALDVFAPVAGIGSQRLARIETDVRWNWLACRNIGMHHATTEWVLLTDIDHVLPVETLVELLNVKLKTKNVYRLSRVDAPHPWPYHLSECQERLRNDGRVHVHPNTWLMTREMFDRIGGYDERLSGCYGTDGEFRDRVQANASAVVMLSNTLVRYAREVVPDASTTVFTRKGDPVNEAELKTRRDARAQIAHWKPLRLTFPYHWEEVAVESVAC